MIWTNPAYNLYESGPYSITAHMDAQRVPFFIAYWKGNILAGACESADAARGVCEAHSKVRS